MLNSDDLTRLLSDWHGGDREALERLMPLVYGELRRLARHYMADERPDHTLEPTALVHEVYLRLAGQGDLVLESRGHFFALAARLMRRLLVDHARAHNASKRGGEAVKIQLQEAGDAEAAAASRAWAVELLALDEAMTRLAELDRRKSRIVELRFFGGLTLEETAEHLGVSTATVILDSRLARAWLVKELKGERL